MPSLLALAPRASFGEVKDTLSSWDKCMAKTYCKWPVIVAIIVGSLIVLSVVMCVARCICCGAECACCCFKCCAGCCGSGRGKKHKRMGSEPTPAYPPAYPAAYPPPPIDTRPQNEQYRSHAAPTISPVNTYRGAPVTVEPERPQFATFETPSKPVNEDALPAMPEWAAAKSTHVEEEVIPEKKGDVELDRFDANGSVAGASIGGTTAVAAGAGRRTPGRSPIQRSPTGDSYGFPEGYQNGAMANGPPRRSPHNSPGPYGAQYGQQQDQYRGASPAQSLSPVYGQGAGPGFSQNQQYGRNSPGQGYEQPYNRPPQGHSPAPQGANGYGYGPSDVSDMDDSSYGPARSHTPGYAPVRSNTPGYAQPQPNAPGYAPARTHTPQGYAPSSAYSESVYAPSESTRYEPSNTSNAYPGQQTYAPPESAYPGQTQYQAFNPGQPQGSQQSGVARRPINGSWKEV